MKRTPLYDEHVRLHARMVEYAGYEMPLQYTSIKEEHHAVRNRAGVFDVSHMGEIHIQGSEATDLLDHIFTNRVRAMTAQEIQYGFLTNEKGGVVDDLLVYKVNDEFYLLVVNAANKDKDFAWIKEKNNFDATVIDKTDSYAEIALQGPKAEEILQTYTETDLSAIRFFTFAEFEIADKSFLVSRTGYTGEDGFEIYGENDDVKMLFSRLLAENEKLLPAGLGCRDTLRFEAGLPLYGHEIDADITPLEAGYGFAVDLRKERFLGQDVLIRQKEAGLQRKVVGLELLDKGILREGYDVYHEDERIGRTLSGYLSPTLEKPLATAIVPMKNAKKGTIVTVKVRKRMLQARVRNKMFYRRKKS